MDRTISADEKARLQALKEYDILDTPPQAETNAIARLASQLCGTPIALISLIDEDRQWFKANIGLDDSETPRDISFCQYTIQGDEIYEVEDATKNDLFVDNPLVTGDPHIRFYAGAPLVTPQGLRLGSLCVIDKIPRQLDKDQRESLEMLSKLVIDQFELRRKSQQLERTRDYFHNIINDAGNIIYTSNQEGYFTFVSQAAEKITGYTPEELLGEHFTSLIAPEWKERVGVFYAQQYHSGKPQTELEFPIVTKNGETRWVEQTVRMRVDDGIRNGFHGIVRDKTEQKKNENAINERNARFFKIFHASPAAMALLITETGRFQEVNQAFIDLSAYTREELMALPPETTRFLHTDDAVKARALTKAQGYMKDFPVRFYTKNRDERLVLLSAELFKVDNVSYDLYICADVTDQKKLEQALITAKEAAEQSAAAKEQFLANMSHEIRTPLNAVIGFTNLLTGTKLSAEQEDFVHSIEVSGKNLLVIINDILDYSKIEAGMMTIDEELLSIRSTFSSLAVLFSGQAKEKKLHLNFHSAKEIPEVLIGDSTRFTQIITNLVGNAIKFTSKGSIDVRAEALKKKKNEILLQVSVEDTGVGIPVDKINQVFERFNQGNNDTNRKFGGTGLGLSIAKKLVELQGGEISAQSMPGKGSTFTFTIPYKLAPAKTAVPSAKAEKQSKAAQHELSLLVVEDNRINQKLITTVLGKFGFKTTVAGNGKEAVNLLHEHTYDLVLMDIQMPEMDGYEATRIIRNTLKSTVPIIAMTAHAMGQEKEKCMQLGMNSYVSKPFRPDDLYNEIISLAQPAATPTAAQTTVRKKAAPKSAVIDLTYLENLSGGDQNFINEVLDIFLEEMPKDMERLSDAIIQKDYHQVAGLAHKIKSSVAMVGLRERLHKKLEALEHLTPESKDAARMKRLAGPVIQLCEKALKEIQSLRK